MMQEGKISRRFMEAIKSAFTGLYPSLQLNFLEDQNRARPERLGPPFLAEAEERKDALAFLLYYIEISDQMTVEDFRKKVTQALGEEVEVLR